MAGDSAGELDPDRAELVIARPDTCVRRAASDLDAVGGGGRDECRLEGAEVVVHVAMGGMTRDRENPREPDDRVRDELAGAVKGHRAAAIDLQELGARGDERLATFAEMPGLALAAHGVHGRMLEQQHGVVCELAASPCQRDRPLQLPGILVSDRPEPRPAQRRRFGLSAHPACAATACSCAW